MEEMNYIFGNNGETENLKTVGPNHTDLSGFIQIRREYPDCTITDSCRIVKKKNSTEDVEGNCYDFYTISDHYRNIDKSEQIQAVQDDTDESMLDLEYRLAMIELGV